MVLIALTGWGQEEDRRRSQEAGFDHHLVKPVDPAAWGSWPRTVAGRSGYTEGRGLSPPDGPCRDTQKGEAMTEDHRSTLSPQEMGERFDLLAADATEYALFLVDPGGRLLCWNLGAERLFGYRTDEVIGQHFSRFFSPEDVISGQPEHELKTARDERPRRTASAGRCGRTAPGSGARPPSPPSTTRRSRSTSFARVMHDLTESQAPEAERKRADGLAEANRGKEEFMAMLSHELRNPLSPILNALGILRQMRTDDPVIQQAGGIIERQVRQMVRLVDDLLDVSRITKGKLRLTKERVELRAVMNRAAESARPLLDARRHEFSLLLPTEPLWVEGDPARLEQVAVNLLNNAAKYTDTGGLVRMTVAREGDDAVVRVLDNGVGIPPDMLPRVFDLFTQVDGSLEPVARRAGDRPGPGPHPGRDARRAGDGGQRRARQGERVRGQAARPGGRAGPEVDDHPGAGRADRAAPAGAGGGGQRRRRGQPEHAAAAVRARGAGGPDRPDRPGGGRGLPPDAGAAGHRAAGDGRVRGGPAAAGETRSSRA